MITFNVGELRRIIRESAGNKNEFSPVYGDGVPSENKKINDKAYADMKKETEKLSGGLVKKKNDKLDGGRSKDDNVGMDSLLYDNMSEPFAERVKSQMKGYASVDAEKKHKNDDFGNADFGTEDDIKKSAVHANTKKKGKTDATEIGLTGKELDKKEVENLRKNVHENKIKRLSFHKVFISENHMLANVPDNLKVENNKFIMRDSNGTEYLVEWHKDGSNIQKRLGKKVIAEECKRIKDLFNYKSSDYFKKTNTQMRMNEDNNFEGMLNKARNLMK